MEKKPADWEKKPAGWLYKCLTVLMGLLATGLLCAFVYFLDIQNPNVATFTIVVFLTFSFGFYVGIPSAVLVLLYSLFFFSKNKTFPFEYTSDSIDKVVVATIFLMVMVIMVGRLKQEMDRKTEELQEANRKLEELSLTDFLTGIANRRAFNQTYEYEFANAVRNQLSLSFLLLDLDFFKQYNDLYGHVAGDECLKKVAGVLRTRLKRHTDLVARYGGEEFVVLLPNTEVQEACKIADYIQEGLNSLKIPFSNSAISDHVTVSIGVTSIKPARNMDPTDVIKQADKALYTAKNKGRNCVVAYKQN